jgi:EmrB/QacA subfamily drug resistance transporter
MSIAVVTSRRRLVLGTIMLATFMVAIETTIVATAMPRIVGQLGGFTYYGWVFSAFLLAQTATTPIYGKLSDMFGRKPVLFGGILLFLGGSLTCGFAGSMTSLIIFRALQGLGAGSIYPVSMTVVGDLYTLEERSRAQGMLAIVWAVSAVIGPLAGGVIIDRFSWAWIFWINLPLGVLTIAGFMLFLRENVEHREAGIDYIGAILFSVAITALLLILTDADGSDWLLAERALLFFVSGGLFIRQEKRAAEPIISINLWTRRLIATSNIATLLAGMAFIGLTTILPIYVQGVLGRSPIEAGVTLTTLVFGWPLAVMLSGRLYRTFGIRRTARVGSFIFPLGAIFLLFLTSDSDLALASVGSFLMGFGMGIISITGIVLVQESVEWSMRGSATSAIIFSRSLGNTLGATALGAVLSIGIKHYGSGELATRLHALLNEPSGLSNLAGNADIRMVFFSALYWSFWGIVLVAVLAVICTWLIPDVSQASDVTAKESCGRHHGVTARSVGTWPFKGNAFCNSMKSGKTSMSNFSAPVWFITGCSTGFGRELAKLAIARGWPTVVTARNKKSVADLVDGKDNALALDLDVTSAAEIAAAVKSAEHRFGRIDVLVNNAGYGYLSSIEEGDDREIRDQFEANVFGLFALTRAVLPGMRKRRQGYIINNTSANGQFGLASAGYYAASKHAVEGFSDALAAEGKPLGINVTCVEPGPFRTEWGGRSLRQTPVRIDDYAETAGSRLQAILDMSGKQPGDPARAAEAMIRITQVENPPRHLLLGALAFEYGTAILKGRVDEFERWRDLSLGADYPAA